MSNSSSRRRLARGGRSAAERGYILPMAAVLLICSILVAGLVLDVGILYMVQSRLSAAVDAGALAGARSLSRGSSSPEQTANAQNTALSYVRANFVEGYFNSVNLTIDTPKVVTTNTHFRTVEVSATVDVPRLMMGWFGSAATPVAASATASRRDVNVVVVMDRSGSLSNSGSCSAVKSASIGFVNKFSEGRDNLGLVTFATSSRPDYPLSNTFKSGIASVINNVTCTGGTSSAQALWQGYQMLANLNQPEALNVILFFTDGQPTAVTTEMQKKLGSKCSRPGPFTGVYQAGFQTSYPYSVSSSGGLMDYVAKNQPMTSDTYVITTAEGDPTGCSFNSNWSNTWTSAVNDIKGLPLTDIWGNSLVTGYQYVANSGGLITVSADTTGGNRVVNAATNATDNAAYRIRNGASPGTGYSGLDDVVIFSIGLGNSTYPANDDLLERIANDPASSIYDNTKVPGMYVFAPTAADLSNAFSRVASEILRLAK